MKRKKKKMFRPLLDIPKGHPDRARYEKSTEILTDVPGFPGCTLFSTCDHNLSMMLIAMRNPELLKQEHSKEISNHWIFQSVSETMDYSEASLVSWFPIQDDDPEMLECGWSFNSLSGPIALKDKMFDMMESNLRDALSTENPPAG